MLRAVLRLARPAALLLVALVVGACVGTAGAANPSASPSIPVNPDRIVFRVGWEGGFVMPSALLGRLPIVVVYADGRVITQGPVPAIYPGPLMPNLVERTLSADALARLIELAREKDLLRTVHYGHPGIADAPDTVLTIDLDGRTYRVSANALAESGDDADGMLDEEAVEGRAALRSFIDALTGLPASNFVDEEHPFRIESLLVYAGKAVVVPDSELPGEQPALDWPLGDLATAGQAVEEPTIGVRCQAISAGDLATVLPVLESANQLSTFRSGGELYTLIVRPHLPGEPGC